MKIRPDKKFVSIDALTHCYRNIKEPINLVIVIELININLIVFNDFFVMILLYEIIKKLSIN